MTRLRTLAIGLAATLVAMWAVLRPDQLWVERVAFEGNVRASDAELRHLADIRNGTTIWGVDLARVSANVQRHPWVERVEAERRLPGTVVVRVEEYTPVALLAFGDGLYYVDDGGLPFLRASSDDLDHPVITGIGSQLEAMHPHLPRLAIHDALWLLEQLHARRLLTRDQVSEIGFHRTRGYRVVVAGGAVGRPPAEVLFDLVDLERQLRRLAVLLDRGVDLSKPVHVDLAPTKVAIVRPLGAVPEPFLSQ